MSNFGALCCNGKLFNCLLKGTVTLLVSPSNGSCYLPVTVRGYHTPQPWDLLMIGVRATHAQLFVAFLALGRQTTVVAGCAQVFRHITRAENYQFTQLEVKHLAINPIVFQVYLWREGH
jgi:hypothetical protein